MNKVNNVNSMKTFKKVILLFLIFLVFMGFSTCSSERPNQFQILFVALPLNIPAISEYGTSLITQMPELTIEEREPLFTAMLMGTTAQNADPSMAMGLIMRLSGMITAREVDIIIANMDNALNMAQGSTFMPLSEILTAQEIQMLEAENMLLDFDILGTNDQNVQVTTGERTPPLGIDISANEQMRSIFGSQQVGIFIVANTTNLELAALVIRSFL